MADGQTIVRYGNVILYHCITRRIEQSPVWDSAGVSLKCWKFVVIVTGYLNGLPGEVPYSIPQVAGAANTHMAARWRLAPRQFFQMAIGCTADTPISGTVILQANPLEGVDVSTLASTGLTGFDVDDGPRCLQFDVTQVSGNNVFRVEAAFEIHRVQCTDSDGAGCNNNGVLVHRWACADSIDVNQRTTRTYHGILEIASSQWSPHWFRSLVVPPIQNGMRRDRMEFVATEDGKKLQYTITDVDVAIAAPYPARTWSIDHTITSLNGDSLKVTEQIAVTLTGDHNVDKTQLITLGLYIISAKLTEAPPSGVSDSKAVGGIFWNDLTISDLSGDVNAVRLSASCWRRARELPPDPVTGKVIALASRFKAFRLLAAADLPRFSLPYDPNQSMDGRPGDPLVYDGPISLTSIFRCYLQTPCYPSTGINNAGANQLTTDNNPTRPNSPQVIPVIPPASATFTPARTNAVTAASVADTIPDFYSSSQNASMYTYYEMQSKFVTRTLRAAMPIANSPYSGYGMDVRAGTAIVKLAPSQTRRIVDIAAERIGDWPEFPDPETMDAGIATTQGSVLQPIKQTVLSAKTLSKTVTKSINGEPLYSARFRAVLALSRAPYPTETLKVGVNKWQTDGATATTPTLTNSRQEDPAADNDQVTPTYGTGGGANY